MQLAYDLIGIATPIGHGGGNQDLDVIATQQRMQVAVIDASLQHKLHRHHHQGHVPMPGLPLTRLILRHAHVALRILERAFDPEALRLHLRKLGDAGVGVRVAQTVFDRRGGVDLAAHDQVPATSGGGLFVPQPHTSVQHFDDQLSFGRVSQGLLSPGRRRLTLNTSIECASL